MAALTRVLTVVHRQVFFVGLAGLGMIIGLILNWDDHVRRGDQLNRSKATKLKAQAEAKANEAANINN